LKEEGGGGRGEDKRVNGPILEVLVIVPKKTSRSALTRRMKGKANEWGWGE
jgi:hypothetical protein